MAIKAIINNTEKEIEQIKNSDEQDIDYVYSRIGDTEVEGEPPISIKSIGGNLADYRIYGNTVDGESVGDRTGNLFDEFSVHGMVPSVSTGELTNSPSGGATTDFIAIDNGDITLSKSNAAQSNMYIFLYAQDKSYIGYSQTTAADTLILYGNSINGYQNAKYARIRVDAELIYTQTNIMLNAGSTALPYEPYGYKVPVTVEGKNLLQNTATSQTIKGVTFTVNADKSVTCNGTATDITFFTILMTINQGSYIVSGAPAGCNLETPYVTIRLRTASGGSDVPPFNNNDFGTGVSISSDKNNNNDYLYKIRVPKNYTCNNLTFYPMIRKADIEDDTYEPYRTPVTTPIYLPEQIRKVGDEAEYIDYSEQKQHRVRKNQVVSNVTSRTIDNGDGTFFYITANHDGSVTCNGYAKSTIFISNSYIAELEASTSYILSGCPQGGKYMSYRLDFRTPTGQAIDPIVDYGNGYTFSVDTPGIYVPTVRIAAGYTCNNLTFYPMIRKADITDDTYEPYIENTEVNTNLPALSTIKGTNTFSVNTSIQPSNIYIKDNFDYKKVFTATRTIEDELPLNYRNIEDNDSTLSDYRIYGNTVGGESVGDRTGNLFEISTFKNGSTSSVAYNVTFTINNDAVDISGVSSAQYPQAGSQQFKLISGETYSAKIFVDGSYDGQIYIMIRGGEQQNESDAKNYKRIDVGFGNAFIAKTYNSILYVAEGTNKEFNATVKVMLIKGSTLPDTYEPYGYKVPVTVSNGTDTLTTPIYLPEPIKMVGEEAEYIDYAEQKQHRVRKNLLQNAATSQTINGVTFTVNEDGSVTCNGTATGNVFLVLKTMPNFGGTCILTGCPLNGSTGTYCIQYSNMSTGAYIDIGSGVRINNYSSIEYPNARVHIRIAAGYTCDNLTFYPMIRKADIEDDTYEPYIENTEVDVTLPALPTVTGTNTMSVGTAVQPSEVYIKGKIKEIN